MKTPIIEMLNSYTRKNPLRLHMPGHKGSFPKINAKSDVTELDFSDNWLYPKGAIAASQRLFASEWGVNYAHYLVGGATCGVTAMVKCSRGSVLMQRSSHISAYNSIKLFGKTAYVINDYDSDMLPNCLTADDLIAATIQRPDIKTWLITSPSYYGKCLDLPSIYAAAKSKDVMVFVDSAHGAHFGLNAALPPCAAKYSDCAVISTHKTLSAFTQTAVLLVNDSKLSSELKTATNFLSTTSPSYLLLASIDYARAYAVKNKSKYEKISVALKSFEQNLPKGIKREKSDDFTRLVLNFDGKNLSGYQADEFLRSKNIYVELADSRRIVAILTLSDGKKELNRLLRALKKMPDGDKTSYANACDKFVFPKIAKLEYYEKTRQIPLKNSENQIAAACVGITPPCCPLIVSGERITIDQIKMLSKGQTYGIDGEQILIKDKD